MKIYSNPWKVYKYSFVSFVTIRLVIMLFSLVCNFFLNFRRFLCKIENIFEYETDTESSITTKQKFTSWFESCGTLMRTPRRSFRNNWIYKKFNMNLLLHVRGSSFWFYSNKGWKNLFFYFLNQLMD